MGAATMLGVTRRTLERLVARQQLKRVRLPGVRRTLLRRDDVVAIIKRGRERRP